MWLERLAAARKGPVIFPEIRTAISPRSPGRHDDIFSLSTRVPAHVSLFFFRNFFESRSLARGRSEHFRSATEHPGNTAAAARSISTELGAASKPHQLGNMAARYFPGKGSQPRVIKSLITRVIIIRNQMTPPAATTRTSTDS